MAAFVFAVLMMVLDHYTQLASHVRGVLLNVLQPVEMVAALPRSLYNAYTDAAQNEESLRRQVKALTARNLLLQAQLQRMRELEDENRQLRLLLDAGSQLPSDRIELTIATVLRISLRPEADFMVLNKGALDHIAPMMPVMDANGVLGLITEVSELTSQARLLTDPELSIPVRFERTGMRAVTRGLGHGRLEVDFVRLDTDVKPGDLLVTSGIGGIFPPGYPVARVQSVSAQKDGTFYRITAVPVSRLYNNHEVLIVRHVQPRT
ncbi:rod shape-determining protein MreC [Sulfurivirga sp.]|uniref:rod shape-determining protein MreC n=1 Tax=Sulfurivirga sp. TaxID=2614236 RepID=UPI0025ED806C|nr:rod shape-determining protein MreC [Sulfurivirga sp.]